MALRENTTRIQFAGGIERKMGEQSVPTTRLLALDDAVFTKAVSLSKRDGYEALSQAVLGSATAYASARGLAARDTELVLFVEGSSLSYIEGAGAWSEIADGVTSIRQQDRALVKTISNQSSVDYATSGGIALVCWEDSRGGVYYAVQEADGGRVTIPPTQADALGGRPRAVRSGDNLVLLWSTAGGTLLSIMVDPARPHTKTAIQPVIDDLVTTLPNFDACYAPGQAGAALTWNALTGIRTAWLTPAGLLGTEVTGWPSPGTAYPSTTVTAGPVLDVFAIGKEWMLAWAEGATAKSALASSDPATPATPISIASPAPFAPGMATIDRIAVNVRSTTAVNVIADVWCESRNAIPRLSYVTHHIMDGSATCAAARVLPSPARINSIGGAGDRNQPTMVTLSEPPSTLMTRFLPLRRNQSWLDTMPVP